MSPTARRLSFWRDNQGNSENGCTVPNKTLNRLKNKAFSKREKLLGR